MKPEEELEQFDRSKCWPAVYQNLRMQSLKLHNYSLKDARRAEFRNRNRYGDVSPYDDTRVHLQRNDIDYINASMVRAEAADRTYLLTQGPLPDTSGHFWLMAWEQKSKAVLMLNKIIEKDQIKCHEYYPTGAEDGGVDELVFTDVGIRVTFMSEEKTNHHYTTRVLQLQDIQSSETRDVIQFHYTAWPDFGVPESPDAFLEFLYEVRRSGVLDDPSSPPIIHCSAGIGRSGTFCLVDTCLVLVEERGTSEDLNILEVLMDMRRFRMGLIQTHDQLRFSYLAIVQGTALILGHSNDQPSYIKELPDGASGNDVSIDESEQDTGQSNSSYSYQGNDDEDDDDYDDDDEEDDDNYDNNDDDSDDYGNDDNTRSSDSAASNCDSESEKLRDDNNDDKENDNDTDDDDDKENDNETEDDDDDDVIEYVNQVDEGNIDVEGSHCNNKNEVCEENSVSKSNTAANGNGFSEGREELNKNSLICKESAVKADENDKLVEEKTADTESDEKNETSEEVRLTKSNSSFSETNSVPSIDSTLKSDSSSTFVPSLASGHVDKLAESGNSITGLEDVTPCAKETLELISTSIEIKKSEENLSTFTEIKKTEDVFSNSTEIFEKSATCNVIENNLFPSDDTVEVVKKSESCDSALDMATRTNGLMDSASVATGNLLEDADSTIRGTKWSTSYSSLDSELNCFTEVGEVADVVEDESSQNAVNNISGSEHEVSNSSGVNNGSISSNVISGTEEVNKGMNTDIESYSVESPETTAEDSIVESGVENTIRASSDLKCTFAVGTDDAVTRCDVNLKVNMETCIEGNFVKNGGEISGKFDEENVEENEATPETYSKEKSGENTKVNNEVNKETVAEFSKNLNSESDVKTLAEIDVSVDADATDDITKDNLDDNADDTVEDNTQKVWSEAERADRRRRHDERVRSTREFVTRMRRRQVESEEARRRRLNPRIYVGVAAVVVVFSIVVYRSLTRPR